MSASWGKAPGRRPRLSPDDVGRRVSVRSRLHRSPSAPGPALTDTVGVLERWEQGVLRIRRRDGTLAAIALDDVVAGRVVPDPPPRRRGLDSSSGGPEGGGA